MIDDDGFIAHCFIVAPNDNGKCAVIFWPKSVRRVPDPVLTFKLWKMETNIAPKESISQHCAACCSYFSSG